MTTAFVLSGGGSLGAVQVGMLQALAAHGVVPDMLVGTSAGAMNAAWVGIHGMSEKSLEDLASVWRRLRRRDVFPLDVRTAMRGIVGRSPAVISTVGLERLVVAGAGGARLEDAGIPVHLVTADLLTGQTVTLSRGPLAAAVLASAAIPGVFPPATVDDRHLVDGGVAHDTGVTQAVRLGASVIYVLPTGAPCALPAPPTSAIGIAMHALTLLIERRLAREVAELAGTAATIKVLPPLCPLGTSAMDFNQAPDLIARARRASTDWIASGDIDLPRPDRFLAAHRHPDPRPTQRPLAG